MKVVTIIGARPQFIKSAPVSKALKSAGIQEVTIHTGQHYDANMSAVFFDEMQLPKPLYRLECGGLERQEMLVKMQVELVPNLQKRTTRLCVGIWRY
jgi:UDP-N-acetylglucosamine 2-epimerase